LVKKWRENWSGYSNNLLTMLDDIQFFVETWKFVILVNLSYQRMITILFTPKSIFLHMISYICSFLLDFNFSILHEIFLYSEGKWLCAMLRMDSEYLLFLFSYFWSQWKLSLLWRVIVNLSRVKHWILLS
jgi:hypothetical protein